MVSASISSIGTSEYRAQAGFEATIGTSVAQNDEISLITDFTLDVDPGLQFLKTVGDKYSQIQVPGEYNAGFTLNFYPQGDYGLGTIFQRDVTGSAGLTVESAAASSTRYTHSAGFFPSPFSVEIWRSVATEQIDRFVGAFVRRATITIEQAQPWMLSLDCGATKLSILSGASPSFTRVTHEPMHGHHTAIKIGGSQINAFETAEVTIDNGLREFRTVNNTKYIQDVRIEDMVTTCRLGYVVANATYWKNFNRNESVGDVDIIWKPTGSNSTSYWQASKVTLKDCYITDMGKAITEGNVTLFEDITLRPTCDGTNPEVEIQYSNRTDAGYSGW